MKTPKVFALALMLGLSACASDEVDNSYVSPAEYQNYSCKQLSAEQSRISKRIEATMPQSTASADQTGQVLNAAITALAITQGYGFSNDESANSKQLRRLQSQYDAIEKISIQKNCMK